MTEAATTFPVKTEEKTSEEKATSLQAWRPFETLRSEVDRLFEDFDRDFWRRPFRRSAFDIAPFWRRETTWAAAPAVDFKKGVLTVTLPKKPEAQKPMKKIEIKAA